MTRVKVEVGVVLWNVAGFIDAAALMTGPACIFEVAELVVVLA